MNLKMLVYLALVTGALTYTLYTVRDSQPPDEQTIERCNELVSGLPENTREEIDRGINRFIECLGD
jgi:hypothetical protein